MPTILDRLQNSLHLQQNLFGRWEHQFRIGGHGCRRKDRGWIRISATSGPVTVQVELHLHRTSTQDVVDEKVVFMQYLLVLIVVMH